MLTDGELRQAYELLIRNVKLKAKQRLKAAGRGIWTGRMLEAIDMEIFQDSEGDLAIEVLGEHYQDYLDEGVNGVGFNKTKSGKLDKRFKANRSVVTGSPYSFRALKPPVDALAPWANSKGISVWAVQNSVYRRGIKPIKFFNEVLDKEMENFTDYIAEIQADNILNGFGDDEN
ncbi:hypothetical protein [Flavobacterium chungangensis]|uniref:HK97 gp10 family phage protein n=1 Tax=Flavobacterium chungangensis TaxID=2708132 RepID=A0ABV8ZE56_9FLAO